MWALSTCQPQHCTGPVGASSPKGRSRPCAADIWNWALCPCRANMRPKQVSGTRSFQCRAWVPGHLVRACPGGGPQAAPPSKNLQGFPGRHGPGPSTLPRSPPGSLACSLGLSGSSSALNSQGDLCLLGTQQAWRYAWGAQRGDPESSVCLQGRQSQPDDPTAQEGISCGLGFSQRANRGWLAKACGSCRHCACTYATCRV